MNDSISRKAAIDVVDREYVLWGEVSVKEFHRQVCQRLMNLPSSQLERKKGKWIIDKGLYKCSSCNQLWTEWWAISKPIERMRKEMPYCPMCSSYNGEDSQYCAD